MNFFRSSTKTYFKESPFRSLRFDAVTVILLLFVSSGVRAMQSQPTILKVSQAILGLVLMPVAVWVLMLLVHWEIRGVVQELDIPAKATTHLHWARTCRVAFWPCPWCNSIVPLYYSRTYDSDSLTGNRGGAVSQSGDCGCQQLRQRRRPKWTARDGD